MLTKLERFWMCSIHRFDVSCMGMHFYLYYIFLLTNCSHSGTYNLGGLAMRESFAECPMARSLWLYNVSGRMRRTSQYTGMPTHRTRICGRQLFLVNTRRSHSSLVSSVFSLAVWWDFTSSFIVGPFFFEELYSILGWETCKATAECYLTLLRESCLH